MFYIKNLLLNDDGENQYNLGNRHQNMMVFLNLGTS